MRRLWLTLAALLTWPAVSAALPDEVAQEGLVLDADGWPVEGVHRLRVRLYNTERGGAVLFEELHPTVEFFEGYYAIAIGSVEPLDPELFLRAELWLAISIDNGTELSPRTRLRKVPSAFVADVALEVRGDITPRTVSVEGFGMVIDATGRWVGDPTGLQGPAGPQGAQGPAGPRGPQGTQGPQGVRGPAGASGVAGQNGQDGQDGQDGDSADPADVVPLVVQQLQGNTALLPYLRKNVAEATSGNLTFNGGVVTFNNAAAIDALRLGNNNITGVNRIIFADPGPAEGLSWTGSAAQIIVSGAANQNTDGPLRLINDADGIRLEAPTAIVGDLSISGVISAVQRITTTVVNATTLTATNATLGTATVTTGSITTATIGTLTGPGAVTRVTGDLSLERDVRLGANTDFIGTLRTHAIGATGDIGASGNVQAANLRANASITAGGNIEAGAAGLVRAGTGGFYVGNKRVFDGNGTLLARPQYACAAGHVLVGTDANGVARCVNVTCPAGRYFRGFDANLTPVCVADAGLTALPAVTCAAGQSVVRVESNGRAHCAPKVAPAQRCGDGEFLVGFDANGGLLCERPPIEPPLRPDVLVCPSAGRNIAAMLQAGGLGFNVANGCVPTASTQAMLITRSGTGRYDINALRAYVANGGIVLTEYNVSHTIYNNVFAAAVGQGTRRGNCSDNVNPPVRFNTGDRFWLDNGGQAVHVGSTGCGYQIDHFPSIVKLGGWAVNQTYLGYRDHGQGRLWLVDVDWQDNSAAFTVQSEALMRYMITHRR